MAGQAYDTGVVQPGDEGCGFLGNGIMEIDELHGLHFFPSRAPAAVIVAGLQSLLKAL